jgi:hypothetical protein
MDWSNQLLRCSSLGCLFTEPQAKADKDAGNLSKTAKTHLKSVYVREKYGREKDIVTKQMKKGIEQEELSITLLSRVLKKVFQKNEQRLKNQFITGLPDIFEGEAIENATAIYDVKSSFDFFTFIANVGEPLDKDYYYQLQGYMYLSNAPIAYIAYCLVDCPDWMIEGEKYKLLRSMNVISEESPEFVEAAAKVDKAMTFSDVEKEDRVLIFTVNRDEETIEKIGQKVSKAREYLAELETIHTINQK